MAKNKNNLVYFCKECGYESTKWLGQCPSCKSWDTFVEEEKISEKSNDIFTEISKKPDIIPKTINEINDKEFEKTKIGINEFDNLIGGGIVKGSLTLLGGSPGIGKSTIILQIAKKLGEQNKNVLYVSGEESLSQIKLRANRIGKFSDSVKFVSETSINKIIKLALNTNPDLLIIDSIQTMSSDAEDKTPGSISQVKIATSNFFRLSKEYNISTIIIGHITKDGAVAGPKIMEHMVDTVLYFEDDALKNLRILRCRKNRFGSSDELAVFEMNETGLKEITNPSEIFLEGRPKDATGCVVTCIVESNKPILIEVQALVTKSLYGMARRNASGIDINRLNLLIAIIEKRMQIPLFEYDIYVNITGGLKIKDASIDLAIIMAIISSFSNKVLGDDVIYCGEVGLSGEVRSIINVNKRIQEGMKLGFKKIFLPKSNIDNLDKNTLDKYKNIEIKAITDLMT